MDTSVNSIHRLPLPITNTLSNTQNNPRPKVDCFVTNLSISFCADQYLVFDENSYLYEHTISYHTYSFFSQGSKSRIGIIIIYKI